MSKRVDPNRTVVINGDLRITGPGQVLKSETFANVLDEYVRTLEKNRSRKLKAIRPFMHHGEMNNEKFVDFLILLNMRPLKEIIREGYFDIGYSAEEYSAILAPFLEGLYNYWRNLQRFMVKEEPYVAGAAAKNSKAHSLTLNNEELKKILLNLYRNLMFNVDGKDLTVFRQLPTAAQVAFLVDHFHFPHDVKAKNESLYGVPYVWEAIFEPPVIFYTENTKRNGIFPIKDDKKILERFYMDADNWFAIPILCGRLLINVYVQKDYLELGAGLFNLFELAPPEVFTRRKPDGCVLFGLDESLFDEDEKRGFVVNEDGVFYGLLPNTAEMDYFGYMKKMVLTIHNIIQIKNFWLPIHGAFAKIHMKDAAKTYNVMLVGDSGAGKSETLDAISKVSTEDNCSVDILIDDMGSLHFNREGELMAVGTEIGAFVRLDDLSPGYAYSTMDRSIFMNPHVVNARVIVPQMSYDDISASTPVDYVFYINNYEAVGPDCPPVEVISDVGRALEVFSEGKRMAKGTTGEVGMTTTYFANPFGAVQLKPEHEKITQNYFDRMKESGVKFGTIRTQLGIAGNEHTGPEVAAKGIVDFLSRESS